MLGRRRSRRADEPLEKCLENLASFLDEHPPEGGFNADGARNFARLIRLSAAEVREGRAEGLRRFLGLFGGMGSLNDAVYPSSLQRTYDRLTEEAWEMATQARREVDRA